MFHFLKSGANVTFTVLPSKFRHHMLVLMDILSNRGKADANANANADSNKICSNDFECNICLEHVKDPVVTLCGHLYCWPCIYKWINSTSWEHNEKPECPICKSEISESTLVPLYGRGETTSSSEGEAHQDGNVVPPRPLGPRSLDTATVSQPELEQAEAEAEAPPAQESSLHICLQYGPYKLDFRKFD